MMRRVTRVNGACADASKGRPVLEASKIVWNGFMLIGAFAAPFYATFPALILFFVSTYITLLLGHSVGMHRIMIHRSADARLWLERGLILLGTWVGIGGPRHVITLHDLRDWAQRQADCHDFFSHRRGYWRDLSWQLFYRFDFTHPPTVTIESKFADDPFYRHLSQFWRWHQIGLAALLFLAGGLPFVLWGICARVAVSTVGHWSVTYVCHNPGPGRFRVMGAGVQASDLRIPFAGVLTHGECWHSNHHAFPESARIGLDTGQTDPAAWVIEWLSRRGLVTRIERPRSKTEQDDLIEQTDMTLSQETCKGSL